MKTLGRQQIIDIGLSAGEEGCQIVAAGEPGMVANVKKSKTAVYLRRELECG